MKKKYFAPELEEMEIEELVLLESSCTDEAEQEGDADCGGETAESGW